MGAARRTLLSPRAHLGAFADLVRLLTKHRELTWEMTRRDLADRYAGHALGFAWAVGHPLIMILAYIFIFAVVFQVKIGGTPDMPRDYAVYLLSGLVPWLACQESLVRGTGSILSHANLVKQVVFPIEILPVKAVLSSLPGQLIGLLILAIYSLVVEGTLPVTLALVPLLMIVQVMGVIGLCYVLAPMGAYFRDLRDIVQFGCTISLFLMPVVYLSSQVPALFRPILYLNPFSYMVWCYQDALYYGRLEHPWAWVVFVGGSLAAFVLGFRIFSHMKHLLGNVL